MLLKNNEMRIISATYSHSNEFKDQKYFAIVPGINQIPQKVFVEIAKDSIIQFKLESGLLEVIEESVITATENSDDPVRDIAENASDKKQAEADIYALKQLKPKAAQDVVLATTSVDLLNAWKELEKRPKVIEAIVKQIEALLAPPEYVDSEKSKYVETGKGVVHEKLQPIDR